MAVDYFNNFLKSDILQYSSRWRLTELNIYNPFSGITNNASEGMNTVIKRLMRWKEAPLDTMVLCLNYLQNYYLTEVYRGFCDLGNFKIKIISIILKKILKT